MGAFYAIMCGLTWAIGAILAKKNLEKVSPMLLNLARISIGSFLLLFTWIFFDFTWNFHLPHLIFISLSSFLGIFVADFLYHYGLHRVSASMAALVDCMYSPFTILLAFLFLQERFHLSFMIGLFLILGSVFLASWKDFTQEGKEGKKNQVKGILAIISSVLFVSVGQIIVKPVLEHSSVLSIITLRQMIAFLCITPTFLFVPFRKEMRHLFTQKDVLKSVFICALLSSYISLIFWFLGMKYTLVGISALLNQLSTIFIILLAVVFLKEKLDNYKYFAIFLAMIGTLFVIF